jgi:hypothetical protein
MRYSRCGRARARSSCGLVFDDFVREARMVIEPVDEPLTRAGDG